MEPYNKLYEKIKNRLYFLPIFQKIVLGILLTLIPLLLVFPAGSLSYKAKIENCANSITTQVKSEDVKGDYLTLSVEPKGEKALPSSYSEFLATYSLFSQQHPYFAGMVNADKEDEIIIKELDKCPNLSLLYAEVFSNKTYKDYWRHEYYPINLMFKGNSYSDAFSFCYISKNMATELLENKNLKKTEDNYNSLIGQKIHVTVNNQSYTYNIANIYFNDTYYTEALVTTFEDFIIVPATKMPKNLNKEAVYFLNGFTFQNEYLMQRIKSIYSIDDYDVKINKANVVGDIDDLTTLSFFYGDNSSTNWLFYFIIIILAFAYLITNYVFYISISLTSLKYICICACSLLTPYLIWWIIYLCFKNVLLFSAPSLVVYFALVLLTFLFYIFMYFKNKRINRIKRLLESSYEKINI